MRPETDVLEGWSEIQGYLATCGYTRTDRNLRRYAERERNPLPVTKAGRVWAFRPDLDRWLARELRLDEQLVRASSRAAPTYTFEVQRTATGVAVTINGVRNEGATLEQALERVSRELRLDL